MKAMLPWWLLAILLIYSIIVTEKVFDLHNDIKNNVIKFDGNHYFCQKLTGGRK